MSPYDFYFFKKEKTMRVFIYFILGILALSFISCKEDEAFDDVNPNRISFFASDNSNNNLKGTILTNTNFFKFNIFAYYSTATMSPTTTMSPFINNLVVAKSLNTWNYIGGYYWPDSNYIQFFAVASDENNNSLPSGVSNWTIGQNGFPSFQFLTNPATNLQKDLVIASSFNKTKFNSPFGVAMNFKHILTRINITYNKAQGSPYTMTKIELIGVNTSGKFNFDSISGTWSNLTTPLPIVYWQGSKTFKNIPIVLNENMFIIPQSNLTLRFTFRTNQGITLTQNATVSPSQIGGNIRYNVLITR